MISRIESAGFRLAVSRVIALASLLFLLAACKVPEDGITRIQYSFWGSTEQMALERSIIQQFESVNPDIRVEVLPISFNRYPEKVQAMMVGGIAPDVITIDIRVYSEWAARGVLADLTDEAAKIEAGDPIMPVPRAAFERNGRMFAFPINCHGIVMFCNLDALAAAGVPFPAEGLTWPQLAALGPRLARRAGSPTASSDYALLTPSASLVLANFGGKLFDDLYHPHRVTVDTPPIRAAIAFLRELHASKYAVPPDMATDQGSFQLFRDGKVAFFFGGRWEVPNFIGRTKFRWDVTPCPAAPDGSRVSVHGGTALGIWSKARHPEAARRFVEFYASAKGARMAMHAGRTAPVFRSLAFGPEFLGLGPPASMQRFSDTMETGASTYTLYAPGASEVTQIVTSRMEQAVADPALPVSEIIAGLQGDLERWLTRYHHHFGS